MADRAPSASPVRVQKDTFAADDAGRVDGEFLSVIDLLAIVSHWRRWILIGVIAGTSVGLAAYLFRPKTYESDAFFDVKEPDAYFPGDINAALASTFSRPDVSQLLAAGIFDNLQKLKVEGEVAESAIDALSLIYAQFGSEKDVIVERLSEFVQGPVAGAILAPEVRSRDFIFWASITDDWKLRVILRGHKKYAMPAFSRAFILAFNQAIEEILHTQKLSSERFASSDSKASILEKFQKTQQLHLKHRISLELRISQLLSQRAKVLREVSRSENRTLGAGIQGVVSVSRADWRQYQWEQVRYHIGEAVASGSLKRSDADKIIERLVRLDSEVDLAKLDYEEAVRGWNAKQELFLSQRAALIASQQNLAIPIPKVGIKQASMRTGSLNVVSGNSTVKDGLIQTLGFALVGAVLVFFVAITAELVTWIRAQVLRSKYI